MKKHWSLTELNLGSVELIGFSNLHLSSDSFYGSWKLSDNNTYYFIHYPGLKGQKKVGIQKSSKWKMGKSTSLKKGWHGYNYLNGWIDKFLYDKRMQTTGTARRTKNESNLKKGYLEKMEKRLKLLELASRN